MICDKMEELIEVLVQISEVSARLAGKLLALASKAD